MKTEEIINGNKLIAEFMGYKYDKDYVINGCKGGALIKDGFLSLIVSPDEKNINYSPKYHTSWDWLMPVVERINKDGKYRVVIYFDANGTNAIFRCNISKVYWLDNFINNDIVSANSNTSSLIKAVYDSVIQFITWLNLQT